MTTNINENLFRLKFQEAAEADDAPVTVKNLLKKANEHNMALLDYITETGPEIREIFDRMLLAEIRWQQTQRKSTQ